MTTSEILEVLANDYEDLLLADGFEDALLGVVEGCSRPSVACYDYAECLGILQRQGLSGEAASEWMEFNVVGAYVGENTPMFLRNLRAMRE